MTRDKIADGVFLKNFFKDSVGFFTRTQPTSAEAYLLGHGMATTDWISLKQEIDTYPLSASIKENLNILFKLAEAYAYAACSNQPFRSTEMGEKWTVIRRQAQKIYDAAQSAGKV